MTPGEAVRVLALWQQADLYEDLMWRVTEDGVRLFANCNDVFFWATADCEEITAADLPLLEAALADLEAAGEACMLPELFAARKRKLRPQKPFYKGLAATTAALFDACCTEQERADADARDRDWWLAFAASQRGKP